jgi:hypothetical protein
MGSPLVYGMMFLAVFIVSTIAAAITAMIMDFGKKKQSRRKLFLTVTTPYFFFFGWFFLFFFIGDIISKCVGDSHSGLTKPYLILGGILSFALSGAISILFCRVVLYGFGKKARTL